MSRQVMVRQPMANGDNRLLRADVLSELNGHLRIKVQGSLKPIVVKASDTLPASQLFGGKSQREQSTVLQKEKPRLGSLEYMLG